jgi:S1-C subfamily serine protease
VRNLTYEVRRYFQKAPGEGGVIVSKIEPGSKAAVSGIKPYEIITHVNDQPVGNVKDFEKLIAGQGELRLSVKRMTKGRVVKIKMGAATQPASGPTTQPAATTMPQ